MKVTTGNHYLAFVLSERQREYLLNKYAKYQARHTVIVTHHVTIAYNFTEEVIPALQKIVDETKVVQLNGLIIGDGIDCFKVLIDGQSKRPVDSLYHLTSSRARLYKDSDSNLLLTGDILGFEEIEALDVLEGEFQLINKATPV